MSRLTANAASVEIPASVDVTPEENAPGHVAPEAAEPIRAQEASAESAAESASPPPRRKRATVAKSSDPSASAAKKRRAPKPAVAPAPEAAAPVPEAEAAPAPKPAEKAAPPAPPPSLAELMLMSRPGDLERLSINFAEAAARANAMISSSLQQPPSTSSMQMDPFGAQTAISQTMTTLITQPQTLANAQADLWMRYAAIWQDHAARWFTGATAAKPPSDKRFRDPEWSDNPYFSLLRDTYLATSDWLSTLAERAEGVDEHTKRKAAFFLKQAADAASPSNFLLTNPVALRATLQSRGENLVQGVQNFADDLARGKGTLAISQTDLNAFKVGESLAKTPGKVVFRNDLFELLQYEPTTEQVYQTPLLIFPPWINKFYILDLQEKNSFIRWLVSKGHTVFVVSWVNPDEKLAQATFEDYLRQVFEATDQVKKATGQGYTNTVGYCIGGTLLATALAYMARLEDDRIKSATFFAAQTDFKLAGELLVFTDEAAINYVEKLMDASGGVLDSQVMAETFNALRSNDLVWSFVIENYYLGRRPPPFDLLFWNSDQTRMPRTLHLFYLKRFYKDNALAEGKLKLFGQTLSLKDVKTPVFMQSSKEDHIAPAASVYRSAKLFGGPVRYMLAGSGHIAGVINPPAANKYQHWTNDALPDTLEEWTASAEETPGSWWDYWNAWLAERAGPMVPARRPGDGELPVLGDAPGEYVRVKSLS